MKHLNPKIKMSSFFFLLGHKRVIENEPLTLWANKVAIHYPLEYTE